MKGKKTNKKKKTQVVLMQWNCRLLNNNKKKTSFTIPLKSPCCEFTSPNNNKVYLCSTISQPYEQVHGYLVVVVVVVGETEETDQDNRKEKGIKCGVGKKM